MMTQRQIIDAIATRIMGWHKKYYDQSYKLPDGWGCWYSWYSADQHIKDESWNPFTSPQASKDLCAALAAAGWTRQALLRFSDGTFLFHMQYLENDRQRTLEGNHESTEEKAVISTALKLLEEQ